LRQPAGQRASGPASQSGPLSALLSKENALKMGKSKGFWRKFINYIADWDVHLSQARSQEGELRFFSNPENSHVKVNSTRTAS